MRKEPRGRRGWGQTPGREPRAFSSQSHKEPDLHRVICGLENQMEFCFCICDTEPKASPGGYKPHAKPPQRQEQSLQPHRRVLRSQEQLSPALAALRARSKSKKHLETSSPASTHKVPQRPDSAISLDLSTPGCSFWETLPLTCHPTEIHTSPKDIRSPNAPQSRQGQGEQLDTAQSRRHSCSLQTHISPPQQPPRH